MKKTSVPPKREALSQKAAAERLGISASLLRRYTRQGRIERDDDGRYPFPETQDAHEQLTREAGELRGAGFGNEDYQTQRARLARARADELERQNRMRRGELVEASDVAEMLRGSLERVNALLKHVPSKYGPKLARRSKLRLPEARGLLSEIVEAIRTELRAAPNTDAAA